VALLALCVGAVVVACQPVKKAAPPPPPPPPPPTPAVPTPAVSNPDYPDFPDPFVFKNAAPEYLAASTNSDLIRMPTVASGNLATWDEMDELLGSEANNKPNWVNSTQPGYWWAPAVWKQSDTNYFLYYTARHNDGRQCIGGAKAITPEGPYLVEDPFKTNPVACQATTGSIDPSVFVAANGQAWLLWKSDGNCCGLQSYIWAQPLDADGRRKQGTAVAKLIGVTQAWEFGTGPHNTTVEGPSVAASGGSYYLFYSASDWKSSKYATGYARCSALADGGCTKPQNGPILASGSNGRGPGGGEVFLDHANGQWLAYHAWNPSKPIGYPAGDRRFHISRLSFVGGIPRFGNAP
jgi:beta-xylosidase